MKRKFTYLCFMVLMLSLLTSCKSKVPDEKQIAEDFRQIMSIVYIEEVEHTLDTTKIEIERRQTDEKTDLCFINFEMSDDIYALSGQYLFQYGYYDQGGWILDHAEPVGDIDIFVKTDTLPEELEQKILEWEETAPYEYNCDEIIGDGAFEKSGQTAYESYYHMRESGTYRKTDTQYQLTFSLKAVDTTTYFWSIEPEQMETKTDWDIAGHYQGTLGRQTVEVIIDSFDPNTYEAHIVYAKDDDPTYYAGIYAYCNEIFDTVVRLEPSNSWPSNEPMLSADVMMREDGGILDWNISPEQLKLSFLKDTAAFGNIQLERS